MTRLLDLADVVRESGLEVIEIDGWRTRERPASTGGFDPRGVLCHHTGGASDDQAYAEWMAKVGRSDLPPPLCQLALDRDGTVYVCAAGRANHGGEARAAGPMPAGDANTLYVGIEAMNTGTEGWSPVQYAAYVALAAALCRAYGWPASHVRAHRETSVTGKWDPGELNMDSFRADIARAIKEGTRFMTPQEQRWIEDQFKSVRDDIAKVRVGARRNRERLAEKLRKEGIQQDRIEAILRELEAEDDEA